MRLVPMLSLAFALSAPLAVSETIMASQNQPGGASTILWVGSGAGCDFNSLTDALDAATSGDELRVVDNLTYDDAPYSLSKSLTLTGGWDQCQGSFNADPVQLSGGLSEQVMQIFHPSPAAELDIQLSYFQFAAGSASGDGGALSIDGNHEVLIVDSSFGLNNADGNGGAIAISGGANVHFASVTDISFNSADGNGGGVHCEGGASVQFDRASIRSNSAVNGGGIHADDCDIQFYSGGTLNFPGIRNNEATERGGGIHFNGNVTLLLDGAEAPQNDPSLPVLVRGNESGDQGGGINLDGGAHAELINTRLEDNVTAFGNAAVSVGVNSSLVMRGQTDAPCSAPSTPDGPRGCSTIRGNVSNSGIGHIVRGYFNSDIEIGKTEIVDNEVNSGGILQADEDASLLLENALLARNTTAPTNSGASLIRVASATEVVVRWSTLARHQGELTEDTLIDLFAFDNTQAGIGLEGVVIDQPGAQVVRPGGLGDTAVTRAACIVAPEIDTLQDNASSVALVGELYATDPMLVEPTAGNYRLQAQSPAIDVCSSFTQPQPLIPPEEDIDGFERGIANSPEGADNPFDLGAFERAGSFLFSDRFETP